MKPNRQDTQRRGKFSLGSESLSLSVPNALVLSFLLASPAPERAVEAAEAV